MGKLSKDILKKIKKEKVQPLPKWRFVLKRVGFWGLWALSVVVTALAAAVVIFVLTTNDWEFYQYFEDSLFRFIVTTLPYFWLVIFGGFLLVAYYNFRHTEKGYKYAFHSVVVGSLVLSGVLGFALFKVGAGQSVEAVFLNNMPYYDKVVPPKDFLWAEPDEGRLGGKVLELHEETVVLVDFKGKEWEVELDLVDERELEAGKVVQLVGERTEDGEFEAKDIRPWKKNFKKGRFDGPKSVPGEIWNPPPEHEGKVQNYKPRHKGDFRSGDSKKKKKQNFVKENKDGRRNR